MFDRSRLQIEPLLLTPRDAARLLSVCERTLYELTRSGEIPVIRRGRLVRYSIEDLRAWIDRRRENGDGPENKVDSPAIDL